MKKYLSDRRMNMKNAVVTGATSGIGLAVTEKLIEMGNTFYGIGRKFDKEV